MQKRKSAKRIAAKSIMHWIGEAWNDLDSPYYDKLSPDEREVIKYHIHRYGFIIGLLLRCRYRPHT